MKTSVLLLLNPLVVLEVASLAHSKHIGGHLKKTLFDVASDVCASCSNETGSIACCQQMSIHLNRWKNSWTAQKNTPVMYLGFFRRKRYKKRRENAEIDYSRFLRCLHPIRSLFVVKGMQP